MKKITALLLCFLLLCTYALPAFAETPEGQATSVLITVTVPDTHKIFIHAEDAEVFCDGIGGDEFTVERLGTPRILIRPESGKVIRSVLCNGEDVTSQVRGGYLELSPVYEDQTIIVITGDAPVPDPDVPETGDDAHLLFWLILFLASGACIAVSEIRRRKKM